MHLVRIRLIMHLVRMMQRKKIMRSRLPSVRVLSEKHENHNCNSVTR